MTVFTNRFHGVFQEIDQSLLDLVRIHREIVIDCLPVVFEADISAVCLLRHQLDDLIQKSVQRQWTDPRPVPGKGKKIPNQAVQALHFFPDNVDESCVFFNRRLLSVGLLFPLHSLRRQGDGIERVADLVRHPRRHPSQRGKMFDAVELFLYGPNPVQISSLTDVKHPHGRQAKPEQQPHGEKDDFAMLGDDPIRHIHLDADPRRTLKKPPPAEVRPKPR
ncbi:MAG: hypothetical protein U5R30_20880 [Deltaproteobacteria bacterium]|nr:hypothetical protein [Deltaproteobacteria bacterium]